MYSADEVIKYTRLHINELDAFNVAAALHRVAKLGQECPVNSLHWMLEHFLSKTSFGFEAEP